MEGTAGYKHISVDAAEARIQGRLKSGTGVVFALLGGAVIAGLLFVTVSPRAEANPHNAVIILVATGVILGLGALSPKARHERLAIGNEIVHEKSFAGVCWSRRQIDRSSIASLRVQARGAGGRGLAIIGRQGRLLIGGSLAENELEWLRAWVEERLRAPAGSGRGV